MVNGDPITLILTLSIGTAVGAFVAAAFLLPSPSPEPLEVLPAYENLRATSHLPANLYATSVFKRPPGAYNTLGYESDTEVDERKQHLSEEEPEKGFMAKLCECCGFLSRRPVPSPKKTVVASGSTYVSPEGRAEYPQHNLY